MRNSKTANRRQKKSRRERDREEKKRLRAFERDMRSGRAGKARMCTSKRAYLFEEDAIAAALRASVRQGQGLRWYSCPHCGQYHITKRVEAA